MQLKSVGRITLFGAWIGISSAVRKVWLPSSIAMMPLSGIWRRSSSKKRAGLTMSLASWRYQFFQELPQHRASVTGDGDFRGIVRIEDIGVDVDVNEALRHARAKASGRE